ncbi:hypothetical protein [Microvirga yunnanensis]|uniref:hypothetical protein n=1 Tax=Microvirga yunnanensis TaxID=2953740 RepID=UPI0021C974AA|nr:hypothetical protein [Microvirga sp. HBU67655]
MTNGFITIFTPGAIVQVLVYWLLISVIMIQATRPRGPIQATGLAFAGAAVGRSVGDILSTLAKLLLALVAAFGTWWLVQVSGALLQGNANAAAAQHAPAPKAPAQKERSA